MNARRSGVLALLLALAIPAASYAANWTLTLNSPNSVAGPGSTVIYTGTITNTTGAPLALDAALDFSSSPELEQFDLDFSDELLFLDLVIPTSGFTGPIFKVTWHGDAVPGSYGEGELVMSSDNPADPLALTAPFTLATPGVGSFCDIGLGLFGGGHSVAFNDSTGFPAVAYNNPGTGTLGFAVFDGTSWSTTTVLAGIGGQAAPSLAMDADLQPHIAFYDVTLGNLMHAWNPGTGWQTEIVESANDVGAEPALAIDGAGDLHVSYYDVTNGDLRYARRSGTSWTTTLIDATGNVGHRSSVTADENGLAYISYYDATQQDLKLASWNGSAWVPEIVDGAGARGSWSSVQVHEGTLAIAYRDATTPALRYATGTPGSWTSELVDATGDPGFGASLQLSSFGQPRIAFADSAASDVRFATKIGASWTVQDVDGNGDVQVSLGRSNTDAPLLSFRDHTTGEVRFASNSGCGTTDVPVATSTRGPLLVLHGSRPNPFSSSTTFVFALARPSDVQVRVFDAAGRLVAEPYHGPTTAGRHEIAWNGASRAGPRLAPGRYLYEVRGAGEVRVGRLVLLR